MDWHRVETGEGGQVKIPTTWLHLHYYEALNILFRVENSLRVFVYTILKNEFKDKWAAIAVTSDDAESGTIESIARRRRQQAAKFGYLGYEISSPIMHLTSGELIGIILAEPYWKHFAPFFRASKEIVKNKLDEIGAIRNSLAHFRPLREDDVEVVKQNAKQALVLVEATISELFHCNTVVPTNTKDEWYTALKSLSSDHCEVVLYQSQNGRWIKTDVNCKGAVLSKNVYGVSSRYANWVVLNIVSPALLRASPELAKHTTYVSEYPIYPSPTKEMDIKAGKSISIVFSRTALDSNFRSIRESLQACLQTIADESALIQEDNLARGSVVEPARVSATLTKSGQSEYWRFDMTGITCVPKDDDPPEYWGDMTFVHTDFVAATAKYPWMPVKVAEGEFPYS
jgi:hypothetical protein